MQETTPPTVKIYVRLGEGRDENTREISFKIPDGLDRMELLDRGFALDGRDAVYTIAWVDTGEGKSRYAGPFEGLSHTLSGALGNSQRALVSYLRERGFRPEFA